MFFRRSFLYALVCAVISAGTIILVKKINGAIDSLSLGLILLLLTTLSLLPYVLIKKEWRTICGSDIYFFIGIGSIGYFLNTTFYFMALLHAPALNVALINVLIPLMSLLLTFLFFKVIPSKKELCAFFIALLGVLFVITDGYFVLDSILDSYGELMAILSSICWVLYSLMVWAYPKKYSPFLIVFMGSFIGGLCMLPVVFVYGDLYTTWDLLGNHWFAVGYIGIIGTSLLYILYIYSIEYIGPKLTAFIMYSSRPVFVAILAVLLLGAHVSYWQAMGGVLICIALYMIKDKQSGQVRASDRSVR